MSAVRVAQKMKDNPAVALTRVPGLMTGLGNVSGALGQSVPAFNALSESMPDAISWPEPPVMRLHMYNRHSLR